MKMDRDQTSQTATPLAPGDTFTYTISFECSDTTQGSDCVGAALDISGFAFTNIFSQSQPLIFDAGPLAMTPGGTAPPVTMSPNGSGAWKFTADAGFNAGDSFEFQIRLKVPQGTVPKGDPIVISPVGTITDNGGSNSTNIEVPKPTIQSPLIQSELSKSRSGSQDVILRQDGTDNVAYTVSVCPAPGKTLAMQYTIVDKLPPGASVPTGVSNDGVTSVDGEITWNIDFSNSSAANPTVDAVTGCFNLTYSINFPNDAGNVTGYELDDAENGTLTHKTNSVTASYNDGSENQNIGPATAYVRLVDPPVSTSLSKSVADEYYVLAGDSVTYELKYTNSSDGDTQPLTGAVMVDGPLPAQFTLTGITTGSLPSSLTNVTIETSTDTGSTAPTAGWTAYTGSEDLSGVRWVRWTLVGSFEAGSSVSASLTGTINAVSEPEVLAGVFTNCVSSSADSSERIGKIASTKCVDLYLDSAPGPHPYLTKATPQKSLDPSGEEFLVNQVLPGGKITYEINLANIADATGDLVKPTVTDCVPSNDYFHVENVRFASGGTGTWTQDTTYTDANCVNGTPLKFVLDGDLAPGAAAPTILYDVAAQGWEPGKMPTPPGPYVNTVVVTHSGNPVIQHCATTNTLGAAGVGAVDGKCSKDHTVTVPAVSYLQSEKLVVGALDDEWNIAGTTTPGGQMTWRLRVRNVGNTPSGELTIIDILPHVGDTGVRRGDQARNSEFRPLLVSPIVQSGWSVEYSTSGNPYRKADLALVGAEPGIEAANWVADPNLAQLSQYRSLKLSYQNELAVGEEVIFEYNMVAPVEDPSYTDGGQDLSTCFVPTAGWPDTIGATGNTTLSTDRQATGAVIDCPVATNSFGYAVTPNISEGLTIGAEPPRVDVHVVQPMDNGQPAVQAGIGDRVWYDINRDGIQNTDAQGNYTEPGVPGVRVELIDSNEEVVAVTFTDANGLYLFTTDANGTNLQPGDPYKVRFYPPSGYEVTYQNVNDGTSDSSRDSDVPRDPTGSNGIGSYHDTRVVNLPNVGQEGTFPGLIDPTWDMGIWGGDLADISLDKVTKDGEWPDSMAGDGTAVDSQNDEIVIAQGRPVTWIYTIENTGLTRLENVTLGDDHGGITPAFGDADFFCEITNDGINAGGKASSADIPRSLNRGATMRCTIEIAENQVAAETHYVNTADVVGTPTLDNGDPALDKDGKSLDDVTDDDPSSYYSLPQRFAVGDYVWFDLNHNGVQDPSETGVPGVTVELLSESPGWVTRTTTTDANGLYLFDDVPAGKYRVRFSNIPSGYEFTNTTVGSNVAVDSDADQSGLTAEFEVGVTAPNNRSVTAADRALYVGGAIELGTATSIINPTIDAGIWLPTPNVGITKQAEVNKVASGTTVMWTLKVRNTGTGSANGVVVVDTLPEGLEFQAGSTGPTPTYDSSTREVSWVIPTVSPGETVTISYTTLVTAPGGTKLTNAVVIAGNDKDPEGSDDDTIEVEVEDEEETPPTTPTDPTTPTTDPNVDADNADRDRLPHTGSNMSLFAALAATLTAVGAVMVGVSRRRRIA